MRVPNTHMLARRVGSPSVRPIMLAEPPGSDPRREDGFDWAIEALRSGVGASFVLILRDRAEPGTPHLLAFGGLPHARAEALLARIGEWLPTPATPSHASGESWLEPDEPDIARLFHISQPPERAIRLILGFPAAPKGTVMRRTLALGKLLLPCITRFVALREDLERERHHASGLRDALDHVGIAIGVLSSSKHVEFANRAMREIIDGHDGLRASGDSITATSLKDAVRLQVSIDHVIAAQDDDGPGPALMLALPRPSARRPLMAAIMPPAAAPERAEDPAAILLAIRPEGDLSGALEPICRLNGLSPVETRLACCLTMGKTLAEASRLMRIKQQTARAYLRQIFQKTGTNRQADLVRLMMSNLLPFFDRTRVEAIT